MRNLENLEVASGRFNVDGIVTQYKIIIIIIIITIMIDVIPVIIGATGTFSKSFRK
jgi:hypothetical protein